MRDKPQEVLLDALKLALTRNDAQRLFRSGKLEGLFPSRSGVNAEAANRAVGEGLLEIVKTETRGKTSIEWVRLTPKGVTFLHDNESPLRTLQDLRDLLRLNRTALPGWMEEMKQGLHVLADGLERQTRGWMERLEGLSRRVEEVLARLERSRQALPDELLARVPWAGAALHYLDQRQEAGATSTCTLAELFEALRGSQQNLSVIAFHDGLRHLQERRALRLLPIEDAEECGQPEYALLSGEHLLYRVAAS